MAVQWFVSVAVTRETVTWQPDVVEALAVWLCGPRPSNRASDQTAVLPVAIHPSIRN